MSSVSEPVLRMVTWIGTRSVGSMLDRVVAARGDDVVAIDRARDGEPLGLGRAGHLRRRGCDQQPDDDVGQGAAQRHRVHRCTLAAGNGVRNRITAMMITSAIDVAT